MPDFKMLLETREYEFLKTEPRLGRRILLLGLGGSYAYGTANENSDIDFRGVTLNLPSDLLGLTEFEQYEDQHTDTVIYSFNKTIPLTKWSGSFWNATQTPAKSSDWNRMNI